MCDSARFVNREVLTYLNDIARLVPFVGVMSCLILHGDYLKPHTANDGRRFVCSIQVSAVWTWRFRRASSLALSVSRQVSCGLYFPGVIGIKSRVGRRKTHTLPLLGAHPRQDVAAQMNLRN